MGLVTQREQSGAAQAAAPRSQEPGMAGQGRENALDHVVVVVFENRSLDNVLGRLYGPGDGKTFDGVAWASRGEVARSHVRPTMRRISSAAQARKPPWRTRCRAASFAPGQSRRIHGRSAMASRAPTLL
jgi:hypothetical protein